MSQELFVGIAALLSVLLPFILTRDKASAERVTKLEGRIDELSKQLNDARVLNAELKARLEMQNSELEEFKSCPDKSCPFRLQKLEG